MQPAEYCFFWIQSMCMPRSDWASWVQAIGSIVAIAGSLYAVRWQDRRDREHQRQAERDKRKAWLDQVAGLLAMARWKARNAVAGLDDGADVNEFLRVKFPNDEWAAMSATLSQVKEMDAPHPMLTNLLFNAKTHFTACATAIDRLSSTPVGMIGGQRDATLQIAKKCHSTIDGAFEECKRQAQQLCGANPEKPFSWQ